jgi:large subunit ribosomal protein L10
LCFARLKLEQDTTSILEVHLVVLKLEDKKAIVAEVNAVAAKAVSAIAVNYQGLKVGDMTELRAEARKVGVYLKVVRNTLARRALADTEFACFDDALTGPVILAFSLEEPGQGARLIRDFMKKNEHLVVKAIAISGQLLDAKQLEAVAKMPTRIQALTMLASTLQAPVVSLARVLAEPYAKLARVVKAVSDKQQTN